LADKIEESKKEMSYQDSMIKLHKKMTVYDGKFSKQEIIETDVDQRLVNEWRNND